MIININIDNPILNLLWGLLQMAIMIAPIIGVIILGFYAVRALEKAIEKKKRKNKNTAADETQNY